MSALVPLLLAAVPQGPVPYPQTTDNHREVVNFNVETVRGIAQSSNGSIFVLNTHASQVVRHSDLWPAPEQIFQTILNPVALALWTSPEGVESEVEHPDRILVVGGGTHALAVHDSTTGAILDVLKLGSEPADIVVHQATQQAFVACQGDNTVWRIDLTASPLSSGTHLVHAIAAERPRFLSLDIDPSDSTERVYVAAFLSGNGNAPLQNPLVGEAFIVDPDSYVPLCILPDQDIFRIDVAGTSGATAVKRAVGTLMTGLGRHPGGEFWSLNVDAKNLGLSEPAVRGDFVDNRVWIGDFSTFTASPSEQVILERVTSSTPAVTLSYSFPFGLDFETQVSSDAARAFIASPLNDRVAVCDASGAVIDEIDLDAGAIPLNVLVDRTYDFFIYVYCWGSNKVSVHWRSTLAHIVDLDIGFDPTPEPIQEGRELWYDGERSAGGRSSCNSCHPGGKSDFIGWQISDSPTDFKDVMVTQSLLGIEDTFPYHWRGERALIDFNGAFVDLLGGDPLTAKLSVGPDSEFEDFQAFVFSLQNPANPRQSLTRLLEDESLPWDDVELFEPDGTTSSGTFTGVPIDGLAAYTSVIGLNQMSCLECHTSQTGSMNDFTSELNSHNPSVNTLEVPHLREMRHKDQPKFRGSDPACAAVPDVARSGFGVAHSGIEAGILEFLDRRQGTFNLTNQEVADVTAFVRRFDQGIAPAAHHAVILDQALANETEILDILVEQATTPKRWIDLVAFGRYKDPSSGASVYGRFKLVDPGFVPSTTQMQFECSNQTTTVSYTHLRNNTSTGDAHLVFLGIPHGSGHRFALDTDNDDLIDAVETSLGTSSWDTDHDNDGDLDGHEYHNSGGNPLNPSVQSTDSTDPTAVDRFDFQTASLAKYEITADEPVRVDYTFTDAWSNVTSGGSPVFAKTHTIVMQGLTPSSAGSSPLPTPIVSSHSISYTVTDLAGRTQVYAPSNVVAAPMIHPQLSGVTAGEFPLVLQGLSVTPTATLLGSGNYDVSFAITANVHQRYDLYGSPSQQPWTAAPSCSRSSRSRLPDSMCSRSPRRRLRPRELRPCLSSTRGMPRHPSAPPW